MDGDYPVHSEKTDQCEWRADGNLAVVAGKHPKGMDYEVNPAVPPMRIKFEDICWPKDWEVPGLTRAIAAAYAEIEAKYGPPVWRNSEGGPERINEPFWAGLYLKNFTTAWCPEEGRFLRYNEETGAWVSDDAEVIKARIREMLYDTGAAMRETWIQKQTSSRQLNAILAQVMNECSKPGSFRPNGRQDYVIHLANTMLIWRGDDWVAEPFSPEFYSRRPSPIQYVPGADCPRFKRELLAHCLNEEDVATLQLFAGMFLLGRNLMQSILIIDGAAGTGKSQIVKIIRHIVGMSNTTTFLTGQLIERFETSRFTDKSLLIGSDVAADFMNQEGAEMLKALVGGDSIRIERKNVAHQEDIEGNFNVLVTSNARLRVRLRGDIEAWRRRIVILRSEAGKPAKPIANFADILLTEEGPGIINWAMEGARKLILLIKDQGARVPLTATQQKRIDKALAESDSLRTFAVECLRWDSEADVTVEEILHAYGLWCDMEEIEPLPEKVAQRQLPDVMRTVLTASRSNSVEREGRQRRGYRNVAIIPLPADPYDDPASQVPVPVVQKEKIVHQPPPPPAQGGKGVPPEYESPEGRLFSTEEEMKQEPPAEMEMPPNGDEDPNAPF